MRTIERTRQFKRDYKRETKGPHRATLESDFIDVLVALANDRVLAEEAPRPCADRQLEDHRDCHIKPDLVLIYRKPDTEVVQLVRLGSHSELGL
ncbi:MAG: type II toxin-antitoxin system YafQ family toxin [Woeseiaceae bacterium]|nr:type II toxin-antitoxin system YafQ family toxin [Woeseiaceae bacterium]